MMGPMALGGRFSGCLLWLGTLGIAFEAPAEEGRIRLVFDASAQGLPEDEVRAAVESELGRPVVTSGEAASGELVILVDTGHLVVRYRTELGTVERHLPTPGNVDDVPLIVSLAAGNRVRDPTVGISPRRAESTPPPEPEARDEPRAHRPPREASFARHWLGLHVAGDIAFVDSESPCDTRPGPEKNFSCFYEGTDDPFFHHGQSEQATFDGGPTFATTRLLLSYDYAFEPWLSVGTRLGYAFGGGPPVGQSPVNEPPNGDPNLVPERTPWSRTSRARPPRCATRSYERSSSVWTNCDDTTAVPTRPSTGCTSTPRPCTPSFAQTTGSCRSRAGHFAPTSARVSASRKSTRSRAARCTTAPKRSNRAGTLRTAASTSACS